jgi:hypothetical protein
MIAKELQIRAAISEHCHVWIQTNEVLVNNVEHASYFLDRFQYAKKLGMWIRSAGCVPNRSVSEILGWMLIESWPGYSSPIWHDELRGVRK